MQTFMQVDSLARAMHMYGTEDWSVGIIPIPMVDSPPELMQSSTKELQQVQFPLPEEPEY